MTRAIALALWLMLLPGPASAVEWVLDGQGECSAVYGREDWARGLVVVKNGVLRPVWSLAGGLWFPAAECRSLACVPAIPLWIVSSTVWGTVEGAWWMVAGATDQITYNAWPVASVKAAEAGHYPLVPFLESHPTSRRERCSAATVPRPPGP